jgi:ubiquinone/menaquinone biosynthesis C-methylase UbiE
MAKQGMKLVDLCCGSCVWNKDKLPVTGVDTNKAMGEYARREGRLVDFVHEDLRVLSFDDASVDIAVMTESIRKLLDRNGFTVETQFTNKFMNFFTVGRKSGAA